MSKWTQKKETALQAIISTQSLREAAKMSGISERQLYNYLLDDEFDARLKHIRSETTQGVVDRLRCLLHVALDTTAQIMTKTTARDTDRLAASRTVMEHALRLVQDDVLCRLDELERIAGINAQDDY